MSILYPTDEPMMLTPDELNESNEKLRRSWAKQAARYDKSMGFWERRLLGSEHRGWACSRAIDSTLEVAIGTGLNINYYPDDVTLTGIDLSPEMLAIAHERAATLKRDVDLREGDAHNLPFDDATFDSVVCTYSLCNIPDPHLAVAEMKRVLRPNGKLILVDHIRSSVKPLFWLQRAIEYISARAEGEYMTRRPFEQVKANGFDVKERDRQRAGVVERLVAVNAASTPA
jgi:ubiquinone/menaquinone biosynthesis C-methylase UbiE